MKRLNVLTLAFLLMGIAFAPTKASAMGEEGFGNAAKSGANYDAWPGILPVINDKHRVYFWWVNGNEKFFFDGDTAALNRTLIDFSKSESPTLEVVLRPGPGQTNTFNQKKAVDFNWELHLIGGIAATMRRLDRGENIWVSHPVLTIYVGDKIKLDQLKIPGNVRVSQIADLQSRYAEALGSTDKTVRGWASGNIASLDRFNSAAMYRVTKLLTDEDDWIKLNAIGALKSYGAKAQPALKQLREAAESEDDNLSKRAKEAIKAIESAKTDKAAEEKHVATIKAIAKFVSNRKEQAK